MDPAVAFGKVLRAVRKEARLSQEQLALSAGVERNFVSLIERGINQPTIRVVFKLAEALNMSPARLVELTEQQVKFPQEAAVQ
ncbi:helix-turn-helix domain-containing protein [Massilia cellulosiltytica]|uniref:helix-turn-helix domain-containing protein n=1 Tax=Massilia cellulosiltytica TaxID=2683234 RepID=UPI0039B5F6AE